MKNDANLLFLDTRFDLLKLFTYFTTQIDDLTRPENDITPLPTYNKDN